MPERSLPLIICLRLIPLVALLGLVPTLFGQGMEITREGSLIALIYTKSLQAAVTVEQTPDLLSWTQADASDVLIGQDASTQTIKSMVSVGGLKQLFFRLRVDGARKVSLAWNPSSGPDVAGYCLHYGTVRGDFSRHLNVGNVTRATLWVPATATTNYFVVTAYNSLGLESLPSKQVTVSKSQTATATQPRRKKR